MRVLTAGLIAASLCGCGAEKQDSAAADANAADFTPPAVTSRLDWGGQQERRFNRLDRNSDGKLTDIEFPRVNSRLVRADVNGDGSVTKIEFTEASMARFDRMDLNRDGTVTSEEQETSRGGALSDGNAQD